MKVTKVVREFIEEKVNEKYPLPAKPSNWNALRLKAALEKRSVLQAKP